MPRTTISDAQRAILAPPATVPARRPSVRAARRPARSRRLSPQRLLIACLVAVVAAAALVVYLERRAAAIQKARTDLVVRQICERTASALATRTRELFGAGVLATIEAIGHREIEQYRLPRIDAVLADGVRQHAYVDRFFFWHQRMPSRYRGQVLFYRPPGEAGARDIANGPGLGGFFAEAGPGAALWEASRRLGSAAESFAVMELALDGVAHQAIFHFMWANPQRTAVFAVIGFVVDLEDLRRRRFAELAAAGLEPLLNPGAEHPRLALRVEDARGHLVVGADADASGELPSASEGIDLLFFPRRELGNYLAQLPDVPRWTLVVRPETSLPDESPSGVWLLGAVVGLLVVAVVCAVGVNREAVRLAQLQSDFVLNVSHQLRTPLAMLSGAAETLGLERLRSPEKIKHYADIVQAQTGRLSALVDQILHVHSADDPGAAGPMQRIDAGELVARAAADVQLLADRRAVRIEVSRPAGPLVIDGDAMALEQVVLNLLENAVKYGDGDSEVRVDVRREGAQVVLRVADRGPGIARADLPHIFEKFYRGRADGPTRRGFGLGLAIVRTTVVAHGGTVAVASEPGQGSVFTVTLPLAPQR